jgi:hypothetical protein
MAYRLFKISTLCLACFIATGFQYASSSSLDDMSSNVFFFQQKLANNGNVQSQYKLGEMYEAGGGVEKNLDQAKSWYQQAASGGYTPAKNRLTYLEIKASGYSPEKYADWVATVVAEAEQRNTTSMLLLAQMHREGVGVKKDLVAARDLLDVLSITGNLGVDREIALVDAEMQANRNREQVLAQERAVEAERLRKLQKSRWAQQEQQRLARQAAAAAKANTAASESAVVAVANPEMKQPVKAAETESMMTAAEKARFEKRKRYEAVMRKLQEEQKILAEQQAWAEERE